jgi:hypothetical protein
MIEEILRQWNKSDVSVEEILAIKNQLFFREMGELGDWTGSSP